MSQSPNVLVAVGQGSRGYIPQQSYSNLFTEFNMDAGAFSSFDNDANFYNTKIRTPSTQGKSDFDIYGFIPGNCKYTDDYSIQQIVDFFQKDDHIELVICDYFDIHNEFKIHQYTHRSRFAEKLIYLCFVDNLHSKDYHQSKLQYYALELI